MRRPKTCATKAATYFYLFVPEKRSMDARALLKARAAQMRSEIESGVAAPEPSASPDPYTSPRATSGPPMSMITDTFPAPVAHRSPPTSPPAERLRDRPPSPAYVPLAAPVDPVPISDGSASHRREGLGPGDGGPAPARPAAPAAPLSLVGGTAAQKTRANSERAKCVDRNRQAARAAQEERRQREAALMRDQMLRRERVARRVEETRAATIRGVDAMAMELRYGHRATAVEMKVEQQRAVRAAEGERSAFLVQQADRMATTHEQRQAASEARERHVRDNLEEATGQIADRLHACKSRADEERADALRRHEAASTQRHERHRLVSSARAADRAQKSRDVRAMRSRLDRDSVLIDEARQRMRARRLDAMYASLLCHALSHACSTRTRIARAPLS